MGILEDIVKADTDTSSNNPVFDWLDKAQTAEPKSKGFLQDYAKGLAANAERPYTEHLKENLMMPVSMGEVALSTIPGALTYIPSWLAGLGYTGAQTVGNALIDSKTPGSEGFEKKSPEEIREEADFIKESIGKIIPHYDPKTAAAKRGVKTIEKGFEYFNTVADALPYLVGITKEDMPRTHMLTQFISELGMFKGIHSVGNRAYGASKRIANKIKDYKEGKGDINADLTSELDKIFKDQDIEKPTAEDLATPQSRQAYIQRIMPETAADRQAQIEAVMGEKKYKESGRVEEPSEPIIEEPRKTVSGEKSITQTNLEARTDIDKKIEMMKKIQPQTSISALENVNRIREELGLKPYELPKREKESSIINQQDIDTVPQTIKDIRRTLINLPGTKPTDIDFSSPLEMRSDRFYYEEPTQIKIKNSTKTGYTGLKENIYNRYLPTDKEVLVQVKEILDQGVDPIKELEALIDNISTDGKLSDIDVTFINDYRLKLRKAILKNSTKTIKVYEEEPFVQKTNEDVKFGIVPDSSELIDGLREAAKEFKTSDKNSIDLDRLPDWVETELEAIYKDPKAPKRMSDIAKQLLETGELDKPGLVKTFKKWYESEKKKVEDIEVSDKLPENIERVNPETGREAGGWEAPEKPVYKSPRQAQADFLADDVIIKNSKGKIIKNKLMAQAYLDELGLGGKLVKDPSSGGWRVRRSAKDKAKFEQELRDKYEQQLKEEGLGDVELESSMDLFDVIGNERGSVTIDFDRLLKKIIKKDPVISGKPVGLMNGKPIDKYGRELPTVSTEIAREAMIDKMYTNIGRITKEDILSPFTDDLITKKGRIITEDMMDKMIQEGITPEYLKDVTASTGPKLVKLLKDQKGEIKISAKEADKIRDLLKIEGYSSNDLARAMRARGISEKQIKEIFHKSSIQISNKGESKFFKKGDDPNELLPRRRKRDGRFTPEVTRSMANTVATAKDIKGRFWNENWAVETGDKTFARITDVNGSGIENIFYDTIKKADADAMREFKQKQKLSKALRTNLSGKSQKRIGIYALAKQEGGEVILEKMGYTDIPKLTPAEMNAYETLRSEFKEFYDRVNAAREAAGETRFPAVDNYFTWINDMQWLKEEHGIGMTENWQTMQSKLHNKQIGPAFRFAKHRGGDIPRKLELNPFTIYEKYSKAALETIHKAEPLAQLHELLRERYGLQKNAPNLYNFLMEWRETQTGKPHIFNIANPGTVRALRILNNNVIMGILSGTVRSALIQPTALLGSFVELNHHMVTGLVKSLDPKEWKRAYETSNTLITRSPDVAIYEAMEGFGKIQKKAADIGLKPLTVLDQLSATATWLGAEARAKALKMEDPIKYADSIVDKTQASAAKTNRAPIQRHIMGQTVTGLQTFVINHWGWLTRDVLGIGKADKNHPETVAKVIKFVLATALINSAYEDFLGLKSPVATPIREYERIKEETDDNSKAVMAASKELLEYIPIYGGTIKYGSQFGGPLVNTLWDLYSEAEKGEIGYKEVGKLMGIPGTNQFSKSYRAYEREGSLADIILGRYIETPKSGRGRTGRGSRSSR